mmetsp:Transcript_3740/g.10538  ORF Transcript_3740/g.10538 Transcript_3740/m.10538 type:complete len:207 (-) Transcript_3740:906-1526(-)
MNTTELAVATMKTEVETGAAVGTIRKVQDAEANRPGTQIVMVVGSMKNVLARAGDVQSATREMMVETRRVPSAGRRTGGKCKEAAVVPAATMSMSARTSVTVTNSEVAGQAQMAKMAIKARNVNLQGPGVQAPFLHPNRSRMHRNGHRALNLTVLGMCLTRGPKCSTRQSVTSSMTPKASCTMATSRVPTSRRTKGAMMAARLSSK